MTLRALVVDDSIIFRKVVRDALATIDGVEVVGVAKDGLEAIEKIKKLKPDLVTLDLEMPGCDGLGVLTEIQKRKIATNAIMVSSLTSRGAEITTRALSMGAFDFILKPVSNNLQEGTSKLASELRRRVAPLLEASSKPSAVPPMKRSVRGGPPASIGAAKSTSDSIANRPKVVAVPRGIEAIFIGISTGGPKALAAIMPQLPANLNVPVIMVQHMPALFTATMANSLNEKTSLNVVEAADGMRFDGGGIYIAPGGKQLSVTQDVAGRYLAKVDDSPPIKACKPSVDYMLNSVTPFAAGKSLVIIMTGMGNDGRDGCERLRKHGATIWSQSQKTCTVYGMPRQVEESGLSDNVFDLEQLPGLITQLNTRAALRHSRPTQRQTETV